MDAVVRIGATGFYGKGNPGAPARRLGRLGVSALGASLVGLMAAALVALVIAALEVRL